MTTSAFTEKVRCYLVATILLLSPVLIICQDCPAIACNDEIQISLDQDCDFLLNADFFIEGDTLAQKNDPAANFLLTVPSLEIINLPLTSLGSVSPGWNSDRLFGSHLYKIENDCRNSCWGTVNIESKIPPRIVNDPPTDFIFSCSEIFDVLDNAEHTALLNLNPQLSETCENFSYKLTFKDAFNQLPNCADQTQSTFSSTIRGEISDSVEDDLLLMEDMHITAAQIPLNQFNGAPNDAWRADLHVSPNIEDCNLMLNIDSELAYLVTRIDGTYDWEIADLLVYFYTVSGGQLVAQQITSFPAAVPPNAQIIVQASHPNAEGSYSLNYSGDCFGSLENNTCIRQWFISSMNLGVRSEQLIFEQTFKFESLDLAVVNCAESGFVVDCHVDNHPDSIYAYFAENVSDSAAIVNAYPYVNTNKRKLGIIKIDSFVQEEIVIDTFLDNVFLGGEWVLVPVVNKEIRDTIIKVEKEVSVPVIIPFPEGTHNCNILIARDDVEVPICGFGSKGSHKVVRTWSIIDWCAEDTRICTQVFEVRDDEAPEFTLMQDSLTVGIDPWQCTATLFIPPVDVTDKCQADIDLSTNRNMEVRIRVENAITRVVLETERIYLDDVPVTSDIIEELGGYPLGLVQNVPQGKYTVFITVFDECGNESKTQSLWIQVVDDVAPVAICPEELAVTLIPNGISSDDATAKVLAAAFDNGSHDAGCSEVYFKVIRLDELEAANSNDFGFPIACEGPDAIEARNVDKFGNAQDSTWFVFFDDHVTFCCGDENVTVVLRVFDQDPGPGPISPSDFRGNFNDCYVTVNLNAQAPTLRICAPVRYIDCNDDINDMSFMGMPSLFASCINNGVLFNDVDLGDPSCNRGRIEREWSYDSNGNGVLDDDDEFLCTQDIFITSERFDPTTIRWPAHYTGDVVTGVRLDPDHEGVCHEVEYKVQLPNPFNCSDDIDLCIPEWVENSCGLIGYNVERDTLDVPNSGGCSKIINRWTIIDWCNYDANQNSSSSNPNTSNVEAVQDDCTTTGCIATEENGTHFRYKRTSNAMGQDSAAIVWDGFYTFDQVIVITDKDSPVIDPSVTVERELRGSECSGSITITKHAEDRGCISRLTWDVVIKNSFGDTFAEHRAFGSDLSWDVNNIAAGTYTVNYTIRDGCNNRATQQDIYIVGDDRAPTPYCIGGVSTAVMRGDGRVVIWASDFDLGGFDNCDDSSLLRFTFSDTDPAEDPDFDASTRSSSIVFDCDDLDENGGSVIELQVFIWDTNNNNDFCTVALRIDDNSNNCDAYTTNDGNDDQGNAGDQGGLAGNSARIGGTITTASNNLIDGVDVSISSNQFGYPKEVVSQQGLFTFTGNPTEYNYVVSANKNDDYLNGVSTLDLVLIQQHILGISPLGNATQIIAADANNDRGVSAIDIIQLRQLILGLTDGLPNNDSWRFLESGNFIDQANPWPFTEEILIRSLNNHELDINFIGVKIGDVNGNAAANRLQSTESRSHAVARLSTPDRQVQKGEFITIEFESDVANVNGFQLSLDMNKLALQDISSQNFEVSTANYIVVDNNLRISVSNATGNSTSPTVFEMTVEIKESGMLSQLFDLENSFSSEAYVSASNEVYAIELGFDSQLEEGMQVYQNTPNPFSTMTIIPFELSSDKVVSLSIYDTAGKIIYSKSDLYKKGLNRIQIHKDELSTTGILYYQIQTDDYSTSNKMILVE